MTLRSEQSRFDLDDLRLLAALADAGSLAGAARAAQVHHASAWRRLGALEARLGVRLFDRGRAGYQPTAAGEEAIAVARRTLDGLGELERRLAGQDVRPTGPVRLTTTDTLLALLAPALATLRRSHPGILVELVTDDAFFTLTRRDADVALRPAAAAPEGLVARRLATIATAVYAHRDLAAGAMDALDWVAPDDSLAHLAAAAWIGSRIPAERVVLRASSLPALHAAARAGIGATALPCFLGDADPELVRVLEAQPAMDSALWLLTHPDLRRVARIRVLLDVLASHFAGQRRRLEGKLA